VEPWNPNAAANPAVAQRLILKGTASGRENRNHHNPAPTPACADIIMPELPGQFIFLFGNIHLDVRMLTHAAVLQKLSAQRHYCVP